MTVYLSLGANLGDRELTIQTAIDRLAAEAGTVLRQSEPYYSEPWGFTSPNAFCNVCILLQTGMSPVDLLHLTQRIELELGRTHKSTDGIYADRVIDIDLIRAFDDNGYELHLHTPELSLPHPLWFLRPFVFIPLSEIF